MKEMKQLKNPLAENPKMLNNKYANVDITYSLSLEAYSEAVKYFEAKI